MEVMISEEHFSSFDFEIWAHPDCDYPDKKYYFYKIFYENPDFKRLSGSNFVWESTESFETAQEARFAAIGHIDLLEKGQVKYL